MDVAPVNCIHVTFLVQEALDLGSQNLSSSDLWKLCDLAQCSFLVCKIAICLIYNNLPFSQSFLQEFSRNETPFVKYKFHRNVLLLPGAAMPEAGSALVLNYLTRERTLTAVWQPAGQPLGWELTELLNPDDLFLGRFTDDLGQEP